MLQTRTVHISTLSTVNSVTFSGAYTLSAQDLASVERFTALAVLWSPQSSRSWMQSVHSPLRISGLFIKPPVTVGYAANLIMRGLGPRKASVAIAALAARLATLDVPHPWQDLF